MRFGRFTAAGAAVWMVVLAAEGQQRQLRSGMHQHF